MKRWNNLLILGVDAGNFNTKTATQTFISGYKTIGRNTLFDDILDYDSKHYALSSSRVSVRDDKTDNDDFLRLTLFAIGKELARQGVQDGEYDVVLSLGLPPGYMPRTELKTALQNHYARRFTFVCNKRQYTVNVQRVFVCPQDYSALLAYTHTDEMREQLQTGMIAEDTRPIDMLVREPLSLLIDIGGGTVDVVGLEYGRPIPDYYYSLPLGLVDVYNAVNAELRASTGNEISESVINSVLNREHNRIAENESTLIHNRFGSYTGDLMRRFGELKLPFSNSYSLFMGGGAKTIKDSLRKTGAFGKLDFLGDIRAIAMGFEEMALAALARG